MFQLIAPIMFVFMSVRFVGQGIELFLRVSRGDIDDDPAAHGVTAAASAVAHDLDQGKGL